jgi:hypothetical protein
MALIDNSFLIITLCYSCDIIPKRINKFSDEIQEILSLNKNYSSYSDLNQRLIQIKMNFNKRKTGFTALGLIKIDAKTIFSVCAFILSYSVVIIQTSYRY